MSWSDFYLVCFLIGFGLSALALLAGATHLHLPHLHISHGIHVPRGGSALPWFNFGTIAAFLAWFGGAGYLAGGDGGRVAVARHLSVAHGDTFVLPPCIRYFFSAHS